MLKAEAYRQVGRNVTLAAMWGSFRVPVKISPRNKAGRSHRGMQSLLFQPVPLPPLPTSRSSPLHAIQICTTSPATQRSPPYPPQVKVAAKLLQEGLIQNAVGAGARVLPGPPSLHAPPADVQGPLQGHRRGRRPGMEK